MEFISLKKGIKKQSALTENISIKTNCSLFTLIIFCEHSYFLRKSQITLERKQRKKYLLTPFALHRNIQTARKAFIYGLFRNLVRYSNSTITNQFCLEIICCRVRFSFNYLIYPYYPAYMG